MSPDSDHSNIVPPDDPEMGEPIDALADLEQETSPAFLTLIRRKIYRRTTGSQLASFLWDLPKMILMEFWSMLAQLLNIGSIHKGE